MDGREAGRLEEIADALRREGRDVAVERFRAPAWPQLSATAGSGMGAAGAFLLAAGRPAAAFFAGLSGFVVLLLDACGFSPLAWLGPKERRSVAVLPGDPSEGNRTALFLAIPLSCRLTAAGRFSRDASWREAGRFLAVLLTLAVAALAGGVTLLYLPLLPGMGLASGAALAALAAGGWRRRAEAPGPKNLAVDGVSRWAVPPHGTPRPFVLLYSGDPAEVKFFLARYRGPVFRGRGVFVEFPDGACGGPAVTAREGPLVPYRVDPALLSLVRSAGEECGIPHMRTRTVRTASAGLAAMARGFRAITILREEAPGAPAPLPDETALAWVGKIVSLAGRTV